MKKLPKRREKNGRGGRMCLIQALPIVDLVRGIPCAVTKRRHLRKALLQYMDEFDTCRCAPCPNNARPVLSGTECKCVCQTGTFGRDCEKRAPDFTSGKAAARSLLHAHWKKTIAGVMQPCTIELDSASGSQECQVAAALSCSVFITMTVFFSNCAPTQRRWTATGAAGAPGAAVEPP